MLFVNVQHLKWFCDSRYDAQLGSNVEILTLKNSKIAQKGRFVQFYKTISNDVECGFVELQRPSYGVGNTFVIPQQVSYDVSCAFAILQRVSYVVGCAFVILQRTSYDIPNYFAALQWALNSVENALVEKRKQWDYFINGDFHL